MAVPVVQVRPMGMGVRQRLVAVPVRMPRCGGQARVLMVVMAIVMTMAVLVIDGLVRVRVRVALDQEQCDAGDEQRPRCELHGRERLAQRND